MGLGDLFEVFKSKCSTIKYFIRTKVGRNMFLIACAVFVCLFFAPMFQGAVGAAIFGCIGAPMVTMAWRRYDMRHAMVPAIFLCVPMVADMIIYHSISVASCLLVAVVCTIAVSIHPAFHFVKSTKDTLYAYLAMGGVCVCIVVLASLLILLVSIAWWLFCLFLFLAIVAMFFTVVLSSAAYTATDAKRQARKKQHKQDHIEYDRYDLDAIAQDIGLKNELDPSAHSHRPARRRKTEDEPIFYDIDE